MSVPQYDPNKPHYFATFEIEHSDGTKTEIHYGGHWTDVKGAQQYIKTTMNWYLKRVKADEEAKADPTQINRKYFRPPNDAASTLSWNKKKLVAAWVTPMSFGHRLLDTRVEIS